MGNLSVFFVGVCAHLWEFTSRETEHRVVVINAAQDQEINGRQIRAHHAWLRLSVTERRPLPGVRITVLNPADPDVTYDQSFFTCIPRVTTFAPNLPPLSRDVIGGRDPELASAYFDAAGRFFGRVDKNGASFALLEVVTDGDPVLRIEDFRGGRIEDLPLEDGARIQIENLGPGTVGDRDHDFLLNFKIAQSIPSDAGWPTSPASCPPTETPFEHETVGPGCSNSNYP